MFQEKYRRDMEKVTPSPESLIKTKEKMLKACQKKPRRLYYKPLIAVAACLLLTTCIISFAIPQIKSDAPLADAINATDSFNPNSITSNDSLQNNDDKVVPSNGIEYGKEEPAKDSEYSEESESGSDNLQDFSKESYTNIYNKLKLSTEIIPDSSEAIGSDGGYKNAPATESNSSSVVYSDTNNQVKGVQEADIIKTDGKYIYACGYALKGIVYYPNFSTTGIDASQSRVYILSADNGKLNLVSTIQFRSEQNNVKYALKEILLYENTLVLIKEGYSYDNETANYYNYKDYYYMRSASNTTAVEIYDITDKSNPVFKNELYQSGFYNSSRMIGKYLYIISTYSVYNPDVNAPETYIPFCSPYNKKNLMPADCIVVPETVSSNNYNVITGLDVTKPDNFKSKAATLGFGGTIYASERNIYIASNTAIINSNAESSEDSSPYTSTTMDGTSIYRFSLNEGNVAFAASGKVVGYLINQFAMDEYNNALRVAVTVTEYNFSYVKGESNDVISGYATVNRYNDLYVLDMNLNLIGSIHNMAPNETIRSVRFDGDVGYVVTFRNVDPLFAIDLSNPKAPKVLSALKIPGFSTYLHAYGDGLLFGLGLDSNVIKLSMFNVADKTNVSEITVYKLDNNYAYSEALSNHKAILIDPEKNIIGIPASSFSDKCYNTFKLFTFENNAFKELASIPLQESGSLNCTRGIYIGDYLYVFTQSLSNDRYCFNISSYDLKTFSQVDSRDLD